MARTKNTRYKLAVSVSLERSDLRDDGGELSARFVAIDTERTDTDDTSEGYVCGGYEVPAEVRRFDGLRLTSWFYRSTGVYYGARPTFEAGSFCDLEDVERMLGVLRPIEKRLSQINEDRGPPADMADWFGRACEASGVSIVLQSCPTARTWHSGYRYRSMTIGNAVAWLRGELLTIKEQAVGVTA